MSVTNQIHENNGRKIGDGFSPESATLCRRELELERPPQLERPPLESIPVADRTEFEPVTDQVFLKPGPHETPCFIGLDQVDRVDRVPEGVCTVLDEIAAFLRRYIVFSEKAANTIAAWVLAAWLSEGWDRFPHLAISSPEKRCGKTRLLELLALIVPKPQDMVNISPAALYRLVQLRKPTLLMDESQSIIRRGSEASEVIREILNAGIDQSAKVIRCAGERGEEIKEFSIYSPKVFAMIGAPDSVLADRCLPIPMKRKTKNEPVERYRRRLVEKEGRGLRERVERWVKENRRAVEKAYQTIEPFDIDNDRMADLLMPLQAVVEVADNKRMSLLRAYAGQIDDTTTQIEGGSLGVRLLTACREVFGEKEFIPTEILVQELIDRTEEPWGNFDRGRPITSERLASMLRDYSIKSGRGRDARRTRGYFAQDFREAWSRYCVPLAIDRGTPLKKPGQPGQPGPTLEIKPFADGVSAEKTRSEPTKTWSASAGPYGASGDRY